MSIFENRVYHCFGTEKSFKVDAEEAAKMIEVSGIKRIPVNTHAIDEVKNWRDLPIGYGEATWNKISELIELTDCEPVWNINLPQTAEEAILRVHKVTKLGGARNVKLEVLDKQHKWVQNEQVFEATKILNQEGYNIWPLIRPEIAVFEKLNEMGVELIRVQGSAISSGEGLGDGYRDILEKIIKLKKCPVMLDGGIGGLQDVAEIFNVGFDYVLVNSCLFKDGASPHILLKKICEKYSVKKESN